MTVEEALAPIAPVVGLTSVIEAPASVAIGQPNPALRGQQALAQAHRQLNALKSARDNSQSDAAYWGYAGQVSYWQAMVNILEAAELVGPDALPDISPPEQGGVVMDSMGRIEEYGRAILSAAHKQKETL